MHLKPNSRSLKIDPVAYLKSLDLFKRRHFGCVNTHYLWVWWKTRVRGYADMRVCGYAGMRICGYADMRVCGYAGMRICGYADMRVCGYAGMRICGYADMRICGYADMRVCGYAGMRVRPIGLTNRFQKLINNSKKIIAVNTKNHSCEGVFICGKTHVDFHKTLTSIFSAYTTSVY